MARIYSPSPRPHSINSLPLHTPLGLQLQGKGKDLYQRLKGSLNAGHHDTAVASHRVSVTRSRGAWCSAQKWPCEKGEFPLLSLAPSSRAGAACSVGAKSILPLLLALDPHRAIIGSNKYPSFFKTSGMHWAGKIQQAGISFIGRSAQCYLGQI